MFKRALTVDIVLAATSGNVAEVHPKKRKRMEKLDNDQLVTYLVRHSLINACRDLDPKKAFDLYKQVRSEGLVPAVDATNHVICLLSGLGEPGSGCHRSLDPGSNLRNAVEIFNDAKAANLSIYEPSYSALVRAYAASGEALEALNLFEELLALNITPKHRTFTPLLDALSHGHHSEQCFALFNSMSEKHDLIPQEKDYASMLRLCHETKDGRFCELLDAFMEDVLVPVRSATIDILRSWFLAQQHPATAGPSYAIHEASPSASGAFDVSDWELCDINSEYNLRSIDLSDAQRDDLLDQINTAAVDRSSNPRVRKDEISRVASAGARTSLYHQPKMVVPVKFSCATWDDFRAWITARDELNKVSDDTIKIIGEKPIFRSSGPYDVMIDGANIGYYKQNYMGAPKHIDYFQVDAMIKYLQRTGRRVLLVLHCRHLHPNTVPIECIDVIKGWADEGVLLTAPAGSNDDWFWLYAALHWRCQVVTNDEMRDHHFRMLSPRYFNRWKERNQIHFSFEVGKANSDLHGDGLGKKRIKLATDTAASVVHEQFYVHNDQKQNEMPQEIGSNEQYSSVTASDGKIVRKRTHLEPSSEVTSEDSTKVVPLTGLRRRNILLHVPLYYSNRMQKSMPSSPKAYYFPLVDIISPDVDDLGVNTLFPIPSVVDGVNAEGDDLDQDNSCLKPIVQAPALIVGDNAVPIISKWLCCVAI